MTTTTKPGVWTNKIAVLADRQKGQKGQKGYK